MKNTHNTNMGPTYMQPYMGPKIMGPKIMGLKIMGPKHQKPMQVVIIRMHMLKLKTLNQKAFFHISPAFSKSALIHTQLSNIHIVVNHKKEQCFYHLS